MTSIRTVLCYGDSNTYGAVPTLARAGRHRFAPDRRWPGILRRQLGSGWEVIEAGHPSRTTVRDDPIEGVHKNGLKALPVCLESHMPLDLVIRESCDAGRPVVATDPDGPLAVVYRAIAGKVRDQIGVGAPGRAAPKIVIEA